MRLPEAAQLEDRCLLRLLDRVAQNMDDLLRDGSQPPAGTGLEAAVQAVGNVLHVEGRHGFLQDSSIVEDGDGTRQRNGAACMPDQDAQDEPRGGGWAVRGTP